MKAVGIYKVLIVEVKKEILGKFPFEISFNIGIIYGILRVLMC